MSKRRILIVTSSYRPAMIADMQRARLLAWELPKLGWEVEILAPGESFQHPNFLDADSGAFFPEDVPVHSVGAWLPGIFSKLGMRSIGWRALRPMRAKGLKLLESGRFDLVYFTTTQFCLFLMGPWWRKKTGVPYVLDFHDPCYQPQRGPIATTRHRFKSEVTRILFKGIERRSVRDASGVVSVSPAYLDVLKGRYASAHPAWSGQTCRTIPFAAREEDFSEAGRSPSRQCRETVLRLVYVGAGGGIMARAFTLICRALALLRRENGPIAGRARIELFGTMQGWCEGDVKPLEQIAAREGVGDGVREYPQRVSYRRSLELLLEADGALILGVDEEGYMPSKLFGYAWSGRPLLASLRRDSAAYAHFQAIPGLGHALWFDAKNEMPVPDAAREMGLFLEEAAAGRVFDRRSILEPHLAPAMAARHAELFEACLGKKVSANSP